MKLIIHSFYSPSAKFLNNILTITVIIKIADEIIIIKDSFVTDCSIGNLAFRKGTQWFTPNTPLLKGTQREYLLQSGQLQEIEIRLEQLEKFDEIRVINALNEL